MRASPSTNLVRSLPLFAVAGAFFGAGAVVLRLDPRVGPGWFALWALLIALGFISCIGGVVSWLLAGESGVPPDPPRTHRSRTSGRPTAGVEALAPRGRTEFVRPPPGILSRSGPNRYSPEPSDFEPTPMFADAELEDFSSEEPEPVEIDAPPTGPSPDLPEWDEEGAQEEEPYPVGEPAPMVSVDEALRDLDGIERDLVRRGRPGSSDPPATSTAP
jgi:hypothetical protein